MESLRPCPQCGTPVYARYTAGMSKALRDVVKNPMVGSHPRWHILCEKCGNNLVCEFSKGTYEEQQKAKKKLIRTWNDKAMGRSVTFELEVPK